MYLHICCHLKIHQKKRKRIGIGSEPRVVNAYQPSIQLSVQLSAMPIHGDKNTTLTTLTWNPADTGAGGARTPRISAAFESCHSLTAIKVVGAGGGGLLAVKWRRRINRSVGEDESERSGAASHAIDPVSTKSTTAEFNNWDRARRQRLGIKHVRFWSTWLV